MGNRFGGVSLHFAITMKKLGDQAPSSVTSGTFQTTYTKDPPNVRALHLAIVDRVPLGFWRGSLTGRITD
jgi:hypothetical protein